MSEPRIPLSDLDYGPDEEAAVVRVLRSGWLSMGPEVERFEAECRDFWGVRHAIAVANGTAALHIGLIAAGVGAGDEVIQPAVNFVAAANMTLAVGARPVFADLVGLSEPNLNPDEVENLITPRTKAVVCLHYGGHACRVEAILGICRERGIRLIEDACHAPGARLPVKGSSTLGPMLGTIGDAGCFSFFSNKNLATGEGGLLVTDDDALADHARRLRSHGMTTLTWERFRGHATGYDVELPGYNYRLDEIHAALGQVQLAKLTANNRRRHYLVSIYVEALRDLSGWLVPFADDEAGADHLMVVVAPDPGSRERVVAGLAADRIQTSKHYPCIPDFTAFAAWQGADVGIAREFASRAITLPLFPALNESDVHRICRLVRGFAA